MINLLPRFDTFAVATDNSTLSLCLMEWLPKWVVRFIVEKAPIKRLEHVRMTRDLTDEVAKQLLNEKYEALAADKPKRDIMSLLGTLPAFGLFVDMTLTYSMSVKANVSENPKSRLNPEELLSQMK